MKMVFYCVLKTEGDIFVELSQFDFAIKCYKTLKDLCVAWGRNGDMLPFKMKTYAQIGYCYAECGKPKVAMTYYKRALQLAYKTNDTVLEYGLYEKLAKEYGIVGDTKRKELYYKRYFHGLDEPEDGMNRFAAKAWLEA